MPYGDCWWMPVTQSLKQFSLNHRVSKWQSQDVIWVCLKAEPSLTTPWHLASPTWDKTAPQTANGRDTPGWRQIPRCLQWMQTLQVAAPGSAQSQVLTLNPAMLLASPQGSHVTGGKTREIQNLDCPAAEAQLRPAMKDRYFWGPSSMRDSDCRGDRDEMGCLIHNS